MERDGKAAKCTAKERGLRAVSWEWEGVWESRDGFFYAPMLLGVSWGGLSGRKFNG